MTDQSPEAQPPRWPLAVLGVVLPDDPMRDAIVGDLHEEFAHDSRQVGVEKARWRHILRATGVALYAAADFMRWRAWASTTPAAAPRSVPSGRAPVLARARGLGDIGIGLLAFGVIVVAIVGNTILFSATKGTAHVATGAAANSALGLGAVLLLIASASVAAVLLCAGPRWLRRRLARTAAATS
jgi:hypothetical protein